MFLYAKPNARFNAGVKNAKDSRGKFLPGAKVWQFKSELIDQFKFDSESYQDYFRRNCLILVDTAGDATTWRGQASMDEEDSIF
jgi:hypothetical protein